MARAEGDRSLFSPLFWRNTVAFACIQLCFLLLDTFVLSQAAFLDKGLVHAVSRGTEGLGLLAFGVLATFRPRMLRMHTLEKLFVAIGVLAAILFPLAIWTYDAALVLVAMTLFSLGVGWIAVSCGVVVSRMREDQLAACVTVSLVASFSVSFLCWISPVAVAIFLCLVSPAVCFSLIRAEAISMFEEARAGEAPADLAITQPSTFIPLVSQVFVALFLFKFMFGASLRLGNGDGGAPFTAAISIPVVVFLALYGLLGPRKAKTDQLIRIAVVVMVSGLVLLPIAQPSVRYLCAALISAGGGVLDLVIYYLLLTMANRNRHNAVSVVAWGIGLISVGTALGSFLGAFINRTTRQNPESLTLICGALIVILVGYTLLHLVDFSFRKLIDSVVQAVAESPERLVSTAEDFEERCRAIAQEGELSPRESEVFLLLARGRNREHIEEQLVISRNTVKAHVKHIYSKLGIHSQQELIDLIEARGA